MVRGDPADSAGRVFLDRLRMSNLICLKLQDIVANVVLINVLVPPRDACVAIRLIRALGELIDAVLLLPRPIICLAIYLALVLLDQAPLALPALRLVLVDLTVHGHHFLRRVLPAPALLPRARGRSAEAIERAAAHDHFIVVSRRSEATLLVLRVELDRKLVRSSADVLAQVGPTGELRLRILFAKVVIVLILRTQASLHAANLQRRLDVVYGRINNLNVFGVADASLTFATFGVSVVPFVALDLLVQRLLEVLGLHTHLEFLLRESGALALLDQGPLQTLDLLLVLEILYLLRQVKARLNQVHVGHSIPIRNRHVVAVDGELPGEIPILRTCDLRSLVGLLLVSKQHMLLHFLRVLCLLLCVCYLHEGLSIPERRVL